MAGKRDYYEVLGIQKNAGNDDIERAYRKLARQHHPDRNIGDPDAESRFKEVNEAYEVLTDDNKRARYDRYGHAGLEGGGGGGNPGDLFGDLINSFFGGGGGMFGGGGRGRGGPQPGNDIQAILDITLVEAAMGVKRSLTFDRQEHCGECKGAGSKSGQRNSCKQCGGKGVVIDRAGGFFSVQRECRACRGQGSVVADPCPKCRGNGRVSIERTVEVNVPPGVDTGMRLQVRAEGEAGDPGAPRGDLELIVRVADHPHFKREGEHLICPIPVTFSQAALGAKIEIPTLTGKTALTIPKGTQANAQIRIPGEGMPGLRGNRKGDLHVLIVVETPTQMTKRQEELLRELAEIDHKEVSPARKTLLERLKGLFSSDSEKKEGE